MRSLSIILVPLNPPEGLIPLEDPMVAFFSSGKEIFTKDLFFSGHTATLIYLLLIAQKQWLKKLLLLISILVIAAILYQRVHYSIDVLGGILFAWGVYKITIFFEEKFRFSSESGRKIAL